MARIGPLLQNAIARMDDQERGGILASAAHIGFDEDQGTLPVVLKHDNIEPREGESWEEYRERVEPRLAEIRAMVGDEDARILVSGNSVATSLSPAKAVAQADNPLVTTVELDPLLTPTLMDDAIIDVNAAAFRADHGPFRGAGIRVAVLDSGIDASHPYLRVADSVSTAGESVDIPGSHGTHCAGSIASTDSAFPGVAPEVTLIDVKVLRANGSGRHTDIARGVDEALDRRADILSMSLGFNHLPAWSDGGHGWVCVDGHCPLCTAVDNATAFGAIVIVAAGNEHERSERLRRFGHGNSFDTELGCPGQSRGAITVGAVTKRTFVPAGFTSHGPTSYGAAKPDLSGPGVNIMSTIPVPRDAQGRPIANASRGLLFDRKSGTSMATPIVAGAAALILEERRSRGLETSPAEMRRLLTESARTVGSPEEIVGAGVVDLGGYRVPLQGV